MLHDTKTTAPLKAFKIARTLVFTMLAMAAVMVFSSTGHAATFGNDDRAPLTEIDQSFQDTVGTLASSQNGAFCTAFCVAPDVIATASHCLFGTTATPGPKLSSLRFKTARMVARDPKHPGAGLAAPSSSNGKTAATLFAGTTQLRIAPPIGASQDWAVARLDAAVCSNGTLKLSDDTPDAIARDAEAGRIYQIASHADLPDSKLHRADACPFPSTFANASPSTIATDFAKRQDVMFHTCDTGGGSSGSPMLRDTPNGPEVVGINVGTYIVSRSVTTAKSSPGQDQDTLVSEPIANTAITVGPMKRALDTLNNRAHLPSVQLVR
jgi:Trypsin-like peptidase domain